MAIGLERGVVAAGDRIGMLGIGSGINCRMLAVHWQHTRVRAQLEQPRIPKTDQELSEVSS